MPQPATNPRKTTISIDPIMTTMIKHLQEFYGITNRSDLIRFAITKVYREVAP